MRNAEKMFVVKPEGKRSLGRSGRKWEDNIKMVLEAIEFEGVDWINLARDRDRWWALLNMAMNLRFP
jgi:hypothetical protein